jgi:DNA (cytosine-5)-methyltransferase 1
MRARFAVVDLFAGPGGLAEGFSAVKTDDGSRPFNLSLSIERDEAAHQTLLLRTFLRQFSEGFPDEYYDFLNGGSEEPDWSTLYRKEWHAAQKEALRLELGSETATRELAPRLESLRSRGNTVLIGGPPCQAYSLVGRARNRGIEGYIPERDPKHFLYKEYVRILRRLKPLAFVMENVKGLLSASVAGANVLEQVLEDVRTVRHDGGYQLISMAPRQGQPPRLFNAAPRPQDFVIRAEGFGVPQARHRVIIIGIRRDVMSVVGDELLHKLLLRPLARLATVEDVLNGMPKLRSGLSEGDDTPATWSQTIRNAADMVLDAKIALGSADQSRFRERLRQCAANAESLGKSWPHAASWPNGIGATCPKALRSWIIDPKLKALPNNQARRHMASDLARYLFASVYAEVTGVSPKADIYPRVLAPDHDNWRSGKFADRFRVQLRGKPSTTVTSHISKDGHYFIHPDPEQCRSLTVREAARLQTFPDNYFFKGSRTEQFTQVGNAVPPYLAMQIGTVLFSLLNEYANRRGRSARSSSEPSRAWVAGQI